jgi:hypothetical protein
VLTNSTDTPDVAIPIKESVSSTSNNTNGDTLNNRYIQIAIAVALYWYEKVEYDLILQLVAI